MSVLTISAIKADVGGYVGHSDVHPDLLYRARQRVGEAVAQGLLIDGSVNSCDDDVNLVMTHRHDVDAEPLHRFAWDTFVELTEVAKRLHLYGAGPGVAEMEIFERPSEPFIVFAADKTSPGAWNLRLYKILCDPFNTAGLIIDKTMHAGLTVEVHDLIEHRKAFFHCPEDLYDLLVYSGTTGRSVIKHVFRRGNQDEPVDIDLDLAPVADRRTLRRQGRPDHDHPLPERPAGGRRSARAIRQPKLRVRWMRGSHNGQLMPCALNDAHPARFDGPPTSRRDGLPARERQLIGPRDMLADISFDRARTQALEMADYMRRNGPFEPGRLPMEDIEYTTMPAVAERMHERWEPIEEPAPVPA